VSGNLVLVSTTGKLGIMTSSARFKEAIKPMDIASEAILLALKPVTFRYKEERNPESISQFGLVVEEVELKSMLWLSFGLTTGGSNPADPKFYVATGIRTSSLCHQRRCTSLKPNNLRRTGCRLKIAVLPRAR
jgi:endosialidase-like protein